MRSQNLALKLEKFCLWRTGRKLFGRFSMEFVAGTVTGFYGNNGTGKTSLLHAAAGILTEGVEGDIVWFGEHRFLTDSLRRRVGIQLQSSPVFTKLSVKEQLCLIATARLSNKQQIQDAVEQLFADFPLLAERQHVRAANLNGGTRRLLSIGLASIGLHNGLLILDEPTNDLSREMANDLGNVIRNFAQRDRNAVIVVSHDTSFLKDVSSNRRCYELVLKAKNPKTQATPTASPASNQLESSKSELDQVFETAKGEALTSSMSDEVNLDDTLPLNSQSCETTCAHDLVMEDLSSEKSSAVLDSIEQHPKGMSSHKTNLDADYLGDGI